MMRLTLAIFTLFCLVAGTVTGCVNTEIPVNGESTGNAEYVLTKALPEVTQQFMTYKIIQPDVTTTSVSDLGFSLGFIGEAAPIDPDYIGMSIPERNEILQVKIATGTIEYTCLDELYPLSPDLPDSDVAIKSSIEFLKSLGLWNDGLVAEEVEVGGTSQGSTSHLLVRFTRYVNGTPLTGPGDKFAIRIGDRGKVVHFLIRYPELEENKKVNILEPSVAFEKLQAGDAVFTLPTDCDIVEIEDVYLGYYLESINDIQEILLPFYVFQGICKDSKGDPIEEFKGWVKAVE